MKLNNIENLIDQKPHKYNFEYECGMADYLNLPPIERWITYIATFANPKEGYFPVETINFASEAKNPGFRSSYLSSFSSGKPSSTIRFSISLRVTNL